MATVDERDRPATDLFSGLTAEQAWDRIRFACNQAAADKGEWAGAPLLVEGLQLVLEPRYPFQGLTDLGKSAEPDDPEDAEYELLNQWRNCRTGATVVVFRRKGGKSQVSQIPGCGQRRLNMALDTMHASQAWRLDAELTALGKLKRMITEVAWKYYMLTGSFMESSKRSRVVYFFRKGRPTVAMSAGASDRMRILGALCLHPIGYYSGTFAGCMVPTDEVIAHLLLMRADEHMFWRKANVHSVYKPEAGL